MISICMPYFERQAALARTLESYREHYGEPGEYLNYEVVIADDGSAVTPQAPFSATIVGLPLKREALNPCVPVNASVRASRGEIVVLTNPEVEHRAAVLWPMYCQLRQLGENGYVAASCLDVDTGQWLCKTGVRNGRMPVPAGAGFHFCAMLYREFFDRAGGFDEQYRDGQGCEDTDWLWALARAGAEFVIRDDLVVYHHRTPTRWPSGGLGRNQARLIAKWNLSDLSV